MIKLILFDVNLNKNEKYFESKNYANGKKLVVSDLLFGRLGMSICYDLRFPNLYRKLTKKGNFFSIPAKLLLLQLEKRIGTR